MLRCPRCGQETARRSQRAGAWEHFVSYFYVYPFRCQLCTTRFRAFHFSGYGRHTPDRREYDRLLVRVPLTLFGGGEQADGVTTDLSLNGCSIRTEATFAPGSTVRVRLQLGQAGEVEVHSAVVSAHRDSGMGLQFVRIATPDRDRLSRYLGRFLRPTGTSRRHGGRPRPELVLAAAVGIAVILAVLLWMGRLGGPPVQ